ncbi:13875_t:CDS:2 [Funneliformis geosporum]|nr:13875_t:CDS:2 [Funneliformis geosporum]
MVRYDAKTLENQFKSAASMRIKRKEKGNQDYANDAGYWEGGACNWGGSHNLRGDCETLTRSFSKIDELKNTEKELTDCTSEQEFIATKSRLTRQAEEIIEGLQVKTGNSSSMFDFIDSKLRPLRNEVKQLQEKISKSKYKYFAELKTLKLEQRQIEQRMKDNKQKATNEKDPTKKAVLLQLIEEDGKQLETNLKKQKEIPTSNLKFEPDKYVNDLVNSMKEAIEKRGNNPTTSRNPKASKNSTDSSNSDSEDDFLSEEARKTPDNNNQDDHQLTN